MDLSGPVVSPRMHMMRWAFAVLLLLIPFAGGGGLLGLTALDWSRDGRHVLFVDEGEVWVGLAPEGRDARRLTADAATEWARFGPGNWLVYVTLTEAGYALWRSDLDGERRLLLSQEDLDLQSDIIPRVDRIARPTVSPDGKSVVFVAYAEGQCDLLLFDLESRSVRRLTRTPGPEDTPDFSPDGRFLVFVGLWSTGPALSWDLYILDLEGDGIEQITEDPFFDWCPRFSPDGEWIAFESTARGSSDIHVIRRDGRERTAFTFDAWRDAFPCWGPKGDEIGYGSLRPGGWVLLSGKTS